MAQSFVRTRVYERDLHKISHSAISYSGNILQPPPPPSLLPLAIIFQGTPNLGLLTEPPLEKFWSICLYMYKNISVCWFQFFNWLTHKFIIDLLSIHKIYSCTYSFLHSIIKSFIHTFFSFLRLFFSKMKEFIIIFNTWTLLRNKYACTEWRRHLFKPKALTHFLEPQSKSWRDCLVFWSAIPWPLLLWGPERSSNRNFCWQWVFSLFVQSSESLFLSYIFENESRDQIWGI